MGETAAETLSEIEASRARIQTDLEVLDARLPDRDELIDRAKAAAGVAAGGLVGLLLLVLFGRRRLHARADRKEARRHAEALAEVLGDGLPITATVVHRSSTTGPIALVAALAALALAIYQFLEARRGGTGSANGRARLP